MNLLRQPLMREATTALLVALLMLQSVVAVAPGPSWWTSQNVLAPNGTPDDFAVANVGQLKHMATQAMDAMDAELPGGAGQDIHQLINPWQEPPAAGVTRDNYLAVNRGQLKHVATPFYTRLGLPFPWAGSSGVQDDYQLVNQGQLKHVFSFALDYRTLGQGPATIPATTLQTAVDAWDALPAKPANSTADDLDGDGIPNLQEYLMGHPLFDPNDIDGDRILDTVEDAHPGILSKLNFADAVWDHDADGSLEYGDTDGVVQFNGDGVMNFEELHLELNLNAATTSTRSDSLSDAQVLVWTLAAGGGLAPVSDPVHVFWETKVNADWLSANYLEDYSDWLQDAETFREDVVTHEAWSPDPSVWLIENPSLAYDVNWNWIDLDGDGALDMDRDGDGMPDLWEYRYELKLRENDTQEDTDADGLTNEEEYAGGTNPSLADSDGDGFNDGAEISAGSDPLDGWAGMPLSLALLSNALQYVGTGGSSPPLMVKVTQGGKPVFGVSVAFAVSEGSGLLRSSAGAATSTQATLTTDSKGVASVTYLAGATPGSAEVTATLTEAGSPQTVTYQLSILAGLADTGSSTPASPWDDTPAQSPPEPDLDGDGIPDKWEVRHGLDPGYSNADWDHDQDGFTDVEEYQLGSDLYDYHSRPRASIDMREKYYRSDYVKQSYDAGEGEDVVHTIFSGEAYLYGGETYSKVSGFDENEHPIYDATDRSQDMRTAFENGGYENLDSDSFWPYVFSTDFHYVTSDAYTTGESSDPQFRKYANGTAMELRLTDPTSASASASAEDWSQTYLVAEYSGATDAYGTYLSLPFNKVLGSLKFSRTAGGTKSVTFSGDAEGQVKISGNDRVEIIPNEVRGRACRLSFFPVDIVVQGTNRDNEAAAAGTSTKQTNEVLADSGDPESGAGGDGGTSVSDIVDLRLKRTEDLRVAKWRNSFMSNTQVNLSKEPDVFAVRIKAPQGLTNLSVVADTVDAQGNVESGSQEQTLNLSWRQNLNPPAYYSNGIILGTDDVDCAKFSNFFKVSGNGKLRIRSITTGGASSINADITLDTAKTYHTLPLTIYVLNTADKNGGADAAAKAAQHFKTANERLLQVGIKLELTSDIAIIPDPFVAADQTGAEPGKPKYRTTEVDNIERSFVYFTNKGQSPSSDSITLAQIAKKKKKTEIVVVYADVLLPDKASGYDPLGVYKGISSINGKLELLPNRIFMSNHDSEFFTLAHEIVHCLTMLGHFGDNSTSIDYVDIETRDKADQDNLPLAKGDENDFRVRHNLMRRNTDAINSFNASKRLFYYQQKVIRSNLTLYKF